MIICFWPINYTKVRAWSVLKYFWEGVWESFALAVNLVHVFGPGRCLKLLLFAWVRGDCAFAHRSIGTRTGINQIWPELEPEFDRNFVNRQILLKKMTTRLIILDCAGYMLTFKAVIVFGSKKQISGLKTSF